MHFHQHLRRQRETQNLTVEEAAERLHLSVTAYQDRERNRADMNVPERCGLLVGLGMSYHDAIRIATQSDTYSVHGEEMQEQLQQEASDPFVRQTNDAFIFVARDHDGFEYTVLKSRVQSANDVLGIIDHLAEKKWVTREHLGLFISLSSHHLGISIHPV